MQRPLWKGAISFGLVHIPVHLYSAESRDELDLTMLDRRDFAPIGYKRVNKETGKEVDWDDIVKGYEYEPDQYVVLSDEDLRRANVKATQTIDILNFVDLADIPLTYYERPYYLTPDKGGDKVYALLREALRRSGKAALAQVVLRSKQHLAALSPVGDAIVLDTLRYAAEIRAADDYELPPSSPRQAGISDKEIQMALSLVEGMSESWDVKQYRDSYHDDVLALVKKKIKAKQTHTITEPDEEETAEPANAQIIDLMALLKESLRKSGDAAPRRSSKSKARSHPAAKSSSDAGRARARSSGADSRRRAKA